MVFIATEKGIKKMSEINFVEIVANGLKEHCEKWGHNDKLEELKKDSSAKNFRKLFFKVTHLYYVLHQDDSYSVEFDKKEDIAFVKRCGKDFNSREVDAIIAVEDLIKLLVR